MIKLSRQQAVDKGLKRYFTGIPCKHGHVAERDVRGWRCVECGLNRRHRSYLRRAEAEKQYAKENHKRNRPRRNELARQYRKNNRSKIRELNTQFRKSRPDVVNANIAKRRAAILNALPSWFKLEEKEIRNLYKEAQELTKTTGVDYEVDHIIPLTSPVVCGLHCLVNLRVLTREENSHKHNKFL